MAGTNLKSTQTNVIVKIWSPCSPTGIPLLITVFSEEGGSKDLRDDLNKQLFLLAEPLNISGFSPLERFGTCYSNHGMVC